MTIATMAAYIGRPARYRTLNRDGAQPLAFPVIIDDVRERYGKRDYLIRPVGGEGSRWVESDSVEVER